MAVIGIDLGTTNSVAAVYNEKTAKVEMIPTRQGNFLLPSVVAYIDGKPMVGEHAVRKTGPNVIYETKRIIGQQTNDEAVRHDMESFTYGVTDLFEPDTPYIVISLSDGTNAFKRPHEIATDILSEIRQYAEMYLGEPIVGAVITVPAYFNDAQRKATLLAATNARLNVLRLLNEPTAAAVAYGLDNDSELRHTLVVDAGGGTFDVSLLSIDHGIYHVQAIAGDSHLGGTEFDRILEELVLNDLPPETVRDILSSNKRLLLKRACEQAKRELSVAEATVIDVPALDIERTCTRKEFETASRTVLDRFKLPIEQVFRDACIRPDKVRDVVLVGGTTRIPALQALVRGMFHDEKPLYQRIHPDQVVAAGAAIQATQMTSTDESLCKNILLDVVPLSIGIETDGQVMVPVIRRNTTIPVTHSKMFSTCSDNQDHVVIHVYEGERSSTQHNHLLGTFELHGIKPEPRGHPEIEITFSIDTDGILTVTALDMKTNESKEITFTSGTRLSESDAEQYIAESERHMAEDTRHRAMVHSKRVWEKIVYKLRDDLETNRDVLGRVLDNSNIDMLEQVIHVHVQELDKVATKEIYEERIEELENICTRVKNALDVASSKSS